MQQKIILDINNILGDIELIVNKYIPTVDGLLFIKNNRYPIINKRKVTEYERLGILSELPWYPYKSIPLVTALLSKRIHAYASDVTLFMVNPAISHKGACYIDYINHYEEDIIGDHLAPENIALDYTVKIANEDVKAIIGSIDAIYKIIAPFTEPYPDNYFTFETDTSNFIIVNNGDIRAIRWNEYIEYQNIEAEANHDL